MIALKYDGGVLMAADTLLSYGSLAKWPNIPRIKILGENCAICFTGDYADFQDLTKEIENVIHNDLVFEDGESMTPPQLFSWVQRTLYSKRSDFEPYLCQLILIGHHNGEPFLGSVDDIGTRWTEDYAGTGYGAHIAVPMLRRALDGRQEPLSRAEAVRVLEDCLRTIFYRECRAINKFQIADAANGKVTIGDPFTLPTTWDFEGFSFEKTAIIR